MNPNYNPTAAAAAERAMEEITRDTTLQLEKDRAANLPAKVRQDAVNRVLDALESHPFRTALISQHLEVKEISQPVNGRVIVTLGSLAGADAVSLEILTDNAAPYEDKTLMFEFMLAPRRVADDTLKAGNSGHGPEVDPILENPIETQEAEVFVALPEKIPTITFAKAELPEKEHVTVTVDADEQSGDSGELAPTMTLDLPKEDYQPAVEDPETAFELKVESEEDAATAENEDVLRSIAELNKKKLE